MTFVPTETQKSIFYHLRDAFGENHKLGRHVDESEKFFLDIFETYESEDSDDVYYMTVGVSEKTVRLLGNGVELGVEILALGNRKYPYFENILATCGFNVTKSGIDIEPRVVHRDVVSMYYNDLEMKHIYFAPLFYFLEELENKQYGSKIVTWLTAIPISDSELEYLDNHGADKFEDLLEQKNIDFSDLGRKSVVGNDSNKRGFFNNFFKK